MPETATLVAFCAALLVMQLTPGPDMLLVVGRGIGQGRTTAFCTVIGMTVLAGLIQLPLLILGVASLLQSSPLAFTVLRWAGALYLVWLGGRLVWASFQPPVAVRHAPRRSTWQAMLDGAINTLTNPKPLLFMFAYLPQFVVPDRHPVWLQLLILGLIQKLCGFAILSVVALASGSVGRWLGRKPGFLAWQERLAGALMMVLGVRLLLVGDVRPARG